MSNEEKVRTSVDAARDTAAPTLPTVNPTVEKPPPDQPSLHPAFYIA